jgi:hypothetical protein
MSTIYSYIFVLCGLYIKLWLIDRLQNIAIAYWCFSSNTNMSHAFVTVPQIGNGVEHVCWVFEFNSMSGNFPTVRQTSFSKIWCQDFFHLSVLLNMKELWIIFCWTWRNYRGRIAALRRDAIWPITLNNSLKFWRTENRCNREENSRTAFLSQLHYPHHRARELFEPCW